MSPRPPVCPPVWLTQSPPPPLPTTCVVTDVCPNKRTRLHLVSRLKEPASHMRRERERSLVGPWTVCVSRAAPGERLDTRHRPFPLEFSPRPRPRPRLRLSPWAPLGVFFCPTLWALTFQYRIGRETRRWEAGRGD